VNTLYKLLNDENNSFVWIIAPKRGKSFDNFCKLAEYKFQINFLSFHPQLNEALGKLKGL